MAGNTFSYTIKADTDITKLQQLWNDVTKGSRQAAVELEKAFGGEVSKVVAVEYKVNDRGIKEALFVEKERLAVVDRLVNAYNRETKAQAGSVASLKGQLSQAVQLRNEIARYDGAAGSLFGTLRSINPVWEAQNQKVAQLSRELAIASASGFWDRVKVGLNAQGLINFSNGLVQITQGLQAASILIGSFVSQVNNLVNAVAKLESFKLSFVAAGAGGAGGAQALQEASRIALGLGANLGTVRDGFQKLTPVILNSGGSLTNVSQITQALSSRFAAFGLSADASRRVMNGVIQAFAKGKLQAEELTQQISEADPAFKTDLAGAIGVTVAQLEEMVKAGEITTDVLLRAIPELGKSALLYGKLGTSAGSAVAALDQSNAKLGSVGVTTEQVRTQLDTLSQLNFERLAVAFQPVINAFLSAQAVVIDFITNITKLEGTRGLGQLLGSLTQSVVNLLDAISRVAQIVATAISPILALAGAIANSAPGIVILTGLIGAKLVAAIVKLATGITAGQASFGVLGASIANATTKYLGLGSAAQTAATQVAAAQTVIGAAGKAGAAGSKQLSLFGNAGDLAGTTGQVQQLTLALGETQKTGAKLFPTFSNAFSAIGNGASNAGPILRSAIGGASSTLANIGPAAANAGAAIKGAFSTAASSAVTALATPLTGLTAVLAPLTAGMIVVGTAVEGVKGIMSGAKEVSDALKNSLSDLNAELAKQGGEVQQSGNSWDASVQNVGAASAAYDRLAQGLNKFLGPLKLATYEEAKYNQQTIAAADASQEFGSNLDKLIAGYENLKNSGDGSVQSQQKIQSAFEGVSQTIANRISVLDSQIQKEKALASSSKEVDAAKKQLISVLESEKRALEATARAKGLDVQAAKDQAAAAKEAASQVKAINQFQIDALGNQKESIKAQYEAENQAISDKKARITESYNAQKEQLSDLKASTTEYYNSQKEAIQQVRAAEAARASEQIRTLQALTPAERELQKLRIADLEQQAGQGGREGLEARAQLERIRANEEIARIQEQERLKEAEAKRELAALEKEEQAAVSALKASERSLEKAHKAEMAAIDKEQAGLKAEERAAVEQIDARIAELQNQIKEATNGAAVAAGEFTGEMENASVAADKVKVLMGQIKTIASQIKIPSTGNGRFAGGPVTAGGAYTVNEFGPEMFLSSSGRLSRINAKPWATWRAPSSGTVIPAHVAAGLDIPHGGVRLSRGNSSVVDRAVSTNNQSGRMMGQMIAAINASMRSNNNRDLAATQASQAVQLGKLTHAVNELAEKDWNVRVNIRNSGESLNYARAINRRI